MEENKKTKFGKFHDKYYKLSFIISILLFVGAIIYIGYFYNQTGDFLIKDISLTGGTSVTIPKALDPIKLTNDLQSKLDSVSIHEISDLTTGQQIGTIIQTKSDSDVTRSVLESYLGYKLTSENSSFEFTGASLSSSFYEQLIFAVLVAFLLMSIVIFILFRSFIPSSAVVFSAAADILMTLAVVDFLKIEMSSAGIVAFLMLIGYSVDTDILLTNRVLKRAGNINDKIWSSFKTGITMTLTALVSVLISLFIVKSTSIILTQIFTVLTIGLLFDIFNTWVTNVSLLKWYVIKKEGGEYKMENSGGVHNG
ncbi:MAG: protein translocase subunit SecF [Nanoarchaeota archaeon]|nr:protein translocase subunit SecF [Nanoarchaeota archaeon]